MKITFKTKEESKKAQEAHFLSLSPQERFRAWLRLMYQSKKLMPVSERESKKNNFQIVIQVKPDGSLAK